MLKPKKFSLAKEVIAMKQIQIQMMMNSQGKIRNYCTVILIMLSIHSIHFMRVELQNFKKKVRTKTSQH